MEISLTLDQILEKFNSIYHFILFIKDNYPEVTPNYQVVAKIYYLNGCEKDIKEIQLLFFNQ